MPGGGLDRIAAIDAWGGHIACVRPGREPLFAPRTLVIDRFIDVLEKGFVRSYGSGGDRHLDVLRWAAYAALENAASSDCLYHDLEHVIMNVAVGLDILLGKRMRGERVSRREWLHYLIGLLYFNTGYVRGLCPGDRGERCATGSGDATVALPRGATGAVLAPHVTDRSKRIARHLLSGQPLIDLEIICDNIEYTRFPAPQDPFYDETASYRGLTRAAHYIGAIAEPGYMRKLHALFLEFEENGLVHRMGFSSAVDFRAGYTEFYDELILHRIDDAVRYLNATCEGAQWVASMNAHLHAEKHHEAAMGIARRP